MDETRDGVTYRQQPTGGQPALEEVERVMQDSGQLPIVQAKSIERGYVDYCLGVLDSLRLGLLSLRERLPE